MSNPTQDAPETHPNDVKKDSKLQEVEAVVENAASEEISSVTQLETQLEQVKTIDLQLITGIGIVIIVWLLARRFAKFSVRKKIIQPLTGTRLNLLITTFMMLMLGWLMTSKIFQALNLQFSTAAVMLGLLMLVSLPLLARDVLAGLTLGLRGQLAPGMRLKMQNYDGYVEQVGLSSVTLLGDDGGRIVLPTRQLRQSPYELRAANRIARLSFSIPLPRKIDDHAQDELLEKIRWICITCPYRQPSSPVSVSLQDEHSDTQSLQISLQVASEQASPLAKSFLNHHISTIEELC